MTPGHITAPPLRPLLYAALAYGLFIFLMLPPRVIAINDDFGYLRSVVETLQHGRPWTDDWLEPWAAGFSSISALLFLATGSFYCATYGLLGVLGAVSFYASARLLRDRGFTKRRAILLATLGLTIPTIFWKSIEFTGVALYLPCLLLALRAAERKQWVWFTIGWALAISTRQTAVTWAALPGLAVLQAWFGPDAGKSTRGWLAPTMAAAAGVALFVVLDRGMNKTNAQRVVTDHVFDHWHATSAGVVFVTGTSVFFLAAGLAALAMGPRRNGSVALFRPLLSIGGILLGATALLAADYRSYVFFDHDSFVGKPGEIYYGALVLLAAAGWMFRGPALRGSAVLYALGALLLVCLRPVVWDYYLLDIAVFGFFGMHAAAPVAAVAEEPRGWRWFATTGLVALGLFHGMFVLHFKTKLDEGHALTVLSNRLLESGRLKPDEMSFMPFGVMGWHYHPQYLRHGGADSEDLANFGCYLRGHTVDIWHEYSRALRIFPQFRDGPPPAGSELLLLESFRYCWFFREKYFVVRVPAAQTEPARMPLGADFQPQVFPLDDAGWCAIIRAPTP